MTKYKYKIYLAYYGPHEKKPTWDLVAKSSTKKKGIERAKKMRDSKDKPTKIKGPGINRVYLPRVRR